MNLQCIYLDGMTGVCMATPPNVTIYRPDADMEQKFCKNELEMKSCPRLHEYEDYLKALSQKTKIPAKPKK